MITLTVDDNPTIANAVVKILTRIDPNGKHLASVSGVSALAIARTQPLDVAFLDVEMPGMSGLEVAKQLKEIQPLTDVVFVTGYQEYALRAFELYASGYLLKPVTEPQVRTALANLRHATDRRMQSTDRRVRIQCFGFFEAWCDDEPIRFGRSKTKMLLAYLVDRNGAMCDTQQLICALWPEAPSSSSYASQLRVFVSDLQTTLTKLGVGEMLVRRRGEVGINKALVDCDYYRYLAGDSLAQLQFNGEYMSQYSFGESTLAGLMARRG